MVEIKTPEFPESVYEASVGAWFKSVGDELKAGEAILELHTDKAVQEINAVEDGVLKTILKQVDDVVMPGDALCEVELTDSSCDESSVPDALGPAPATSDEQPVSSSISGSGPVEDSDSLETESAASDSDVIKIEVAQPIPMSNSTTVGEPLAVANVYELEDEAPTETEVDTCDSEDERPDQSIGVLTEEIVEEPVQDESIQAPEPVQADESPEDQYLVEARESVSERPVDRVRLTRRQLTAARRMVQVKQQTVMTTTFNEVDMQQIIDMRSRHGARFAEQHGVKLGFMAFFIKATCAALKVYPVLNSEIDADELLMKRYYDIGIAVASDRGLAVPVIRDADTMSFSEIETAIRGFSEKAGTGAWKLSDLAGGTFTITNGGVFGSMLSTPILNPPQVGILGMHNIVERPIAADGEVTVRPMMYLALTYDHRIVEGAQAVQFLKHVKDSLESADVLLLGT